MKPGQEIIFGQAGDERAGFLVSSKARVLCQPAFDLLRDLCRLVSILADSSAHPRKAFALVISVGNGQQSVLDLAQREPKTGELGLALRAGLWGKHRHGGVAGIAILHAAAADSAYRYAAVEISE